MMGILEGPVTPTLIRDPIRRLCTLVDLARPHGISTTVPLPRFCHMLNDMYELAGVYTKEGNIEKAFVLYLRFVGIVVEELPKHKDYATFSLTEKDNYDRQTIRAMNTAEVLKRGIKAKYEKEAASLKAELKADVHNNHTSIGTMPCSPPPLDLNLKSYVVCQKQSGYSLLFQRVVIPNDLPQKFLDFYSNSSDSSMFAVIYGKLVRNSLIISHLVITDGSEKVLDQLDRCITEIDETNEPIELFIVGCVCGSLSETSVDKFISRSLLTEIICIVCRRGKNQTYVIHLSNLPHRKHEEKGLGVETTRTVMEVEKQPQTLAAHDNSQAAAAGADFQDTSQSICSHVHITPSLDVTITDLRKGNNENTMKFMSSHHRTNVVN